MMNDIDEDEISKKAFTTLTSMGEIAIDVVLGHIAALSIGITDCVGLGEGLVPAEGAANLCSDVITSVNHVASHAKEYYVEMSNETKRRRRDAVELERRGGGDGEGEQSKASEWDVQDTGMSEGMTQQIIDDCNSSSIDNGEERGGDHGGLSNDRGHMSIVWGMLAKLLPVLNGMVYSDGAVREYVWRHGHGVAVLLHVVTRALPLELRVVTVFTLANLTQSHNESLQENAAKLDAVGVLAALMYEVQKNDLSDSDDDGVDIVSRHRGPVSARRSETFCVILQVVHNLVQSCRENITRLVFMPCMNDGGSDGHNSSPSRSSDNNLLTFITRCCVDGTEPDLRNEAAGVLLSVVEMAIEEGGYLLRRVLYGASGPTGEHRTNNEDDDDRGNVDNVLSTLKLLSESFDSDLTSALKARSQQSVRELEELQETGGISGASQKK